MNARVDHAADPAASAAHERPDALGEGAVRRRVRSSIAEEVRQLDADEAGRKEMQLIREQLGEFAPPVPVDGPQRPVGCWRRQDRRRRRRAIS
jgi:hypothetical protein